MVKHLALDNLLFSEHWSGVRTKLSGLAPANVALISGDWATDCKEKYKINI